MQQSCLVYLMVLSADIMDMYFSYVEEMPHKLPNKLSLLIQQQMKIPIYYFSFGSNS
jgi:hypothetical protein